MASCKICDNTGYEGNEFCRCAAGLYEALVIEFRKKLHPEADSRESWIEKEIERRKKYAGIAETQH